MSFGAIHTPNISKNKNLSISQLLTLPNFEDPKAGQFELSDFEKLDEVFHELYADANVYFLDEIQNVSGWERFVRSGLDIGKRFVITGSNASLLSRELGTKLTGRHITHELFPFSYTEMLLLTKQKPSAQSFEDYLLFGGFPGYLKTKQAFLREQLFSDVLARDIIIRQGLKAARPITGYASYLITNAGNLFSHNQLARTFGFGSASTSISYLSFLEDCYLLFGVPKFDYSYKKQIVNPKKVYVIDTGLAQAVSASFSKDAGRMLENAVFLHLRRMHRSLSYFKGKNECDFVVSEKGKVMEVIQVCYTLHHDNLERELAGSDGVSQSK